ncbi:MAG: family 10 glycosylhydrolase, partial [Bacteroidota bacterium]|nr:family 10 glycosylhydrolase [Bacteroidota bacterium]
MIRNLLLTLFSFSLLLHIHAQKTPKRELRGAWITTHLSLDWPVRSQTPLQQRNAFISILNQHKATGMNAMFFQVRGQSDAMYPSTFEPWSAVLNPGHVQGKDPGWDPLLFAIDETHKRGMELHAWINPYRAVANTDSLSKISTQHIAKQHPEWLITAGKEQILNPGLPEVRKYLLDVITDIVTRYDVDGIHFDDYFYPNAPFNDDVTYNADPRGFPATTAGRADWRRDNVTLLIKQLYETIKQLKPWVKFGVSPSGIYRSSTNPAIGSATSSGALQHYSALYADTRLWLQQGWVDYLAPQVYWYIGQTGSDYKVLIPWWNNQVTNGRHIYIGQAIYKLSSPATYGAAWANRSEIPNQMRMNRDEQYPNVLGEIGFRTAFLQSNPQSVRDSIRLNIYKKPALPPTMSWLDATPPQAPKALTASKQPNNGYVLNWEKPATSASEMDKVRQFAIYRSETPVIDINDTANLLATTATDVTTFTDNANPENKTYYYQVTSLDRLYNESTPSNVTDYEPPTITCPGEQVLTLGASCSAVLPDYKAMARVSDDVSTGAALVVTQLPAAGSTVTGVGTTTVTLRVTDASGKTATCTFGVKKEDKQPPVITNATTNPAILFPPNNKMREVEVAYGVTDNCGAVTTILNVTSNEAQTRGAGGSNPDFQIIDNHRVKLRATRSGAGEGRVYTITITATDASGNVHSEKVNVLVPHDNAGVSTAPGALLMNEAVTPNKELQVRVLANPSPGKFTLVTSSSSAETLTLRTYNSLGKVVETRQGVSPTGVIDLGSRYRSGTYYVEVMQGSKRTVIKLVK